MFDELISVIVPVYNVEKYLEKCVDSILNQTYKNLEIILIDDGSIDNSGALCDEYIEKDQRMQVIHKENSGLSDARNVGIGLSHGTYIAFVDSDDYIDSTMIEKLYIALKNNKADISICSSCVVDTGYNMVPYRIWDVDINDELLSREQAISKLFNNNGYFIVAWNKLYKRELFDDVRYPSGRINEDEFVIHKLFGQSNRVVCMKEKLYFYLQRPDSIMGKTSINKDVSYLYNKYDFLIERMQYLKSINLNKYAAESYKQSVFTYYRICECNSNDTSNKKNQELRKEIRINYSIVKYLQFKTRIHLLIILISPALYKRYVLIRQKA